MKYIAKPDTWFDEGTWECKHLVRLAACRAVEASSILVIPARRIAMARDKHLTVEIIDGELRISVGIDTLKFAAEHSPDNRLTQYDGEKNEFLSYKILDSKEFAKDVSCSLQNEEEDGTTPVHTLLDNAILDAIEQGSLAVDNELSVAKL